MRTPPLGGAADEKLSSRDTALSKPQAPKRQTQYNGSHHTLKPERGDGRHPHSTLCEALARSGLFDREISHRFLALAREPSIDAAFEAEQAQDDRCFGIFLSVQRLKGKLHL